MITKCEKCGGKDFTLFESMCYKMELDEDGNLNNTSSADNEIDYIVCSECDEKYDWSDFNEINF